MAVVNITSNNFKNIKTILENKVIKKSLFTNKKLLNILIETNSIYTSGKPEYIYLNDKDALLGVINANGYPLNSIDDLDYFINEDKEIISRDEITNNYSDSKRIESKSFNGLMLSVLDKVEIKLDNTKQFISPMIGTGLFIHYSTKVELDDDIVLVGIENPQVIWYINKYRHLFNEDKKYVFLSISEYKTSYQYKWLESFKGEYLHFGDFDLAGINIYLNTILPKLKKCRKYSFLMPKDIYRIMKEKNYKKDYSNQTRYLNINSNNDKQLFELIKFIKTNKITLEQEFLAE